MIDCTATTDVCAFHGVPSDRLFLRSYICNLSGKELSDLAVAVMAILDATTHPSSSRRITSLPVCVPRVIARDSHFVLRFDGSF